MPLGLIMFLAWLFFMVLCTGALIAWGYREGQFDNIEEPKFTMLLDREPQPWPARVRKQKKDGWEGGAHGR